jgi:hypothetical protein
MMKRGNLMTFVGKMILIGGLLLEALLFAGVAYAQVPPVPTPAPQPQSQTIVGREIAAGLQALSDASNNTNALVLLVIAFSILMVAVSGGLIYAIIRILDAQKSLSAATSKREEAVAQREGSDRTDRRRREEEEAKRTQAFTESLNRFSAVSTGIARIEEAIGTLTKDRTESKGRTEARDKLYFERIDTVEGRIVNSMNHFGDRMAHELPQALREGQVQAAQLLIDNLPVILAQAAAANAIANAATPPPDAVDKIEIHAENVEVNTKDKGESS